MRNIKYLLFFFITITCYVNKLLANPIKELICNPYTNKIWFQQNDTLPVINAFFSFKICPKLESIQGITYMLQCALFKNVGDLDEAQTAERFEDLRGTLGMSVSNTNIAFKIFSHKDDFDQFLDLFNQSLTPKTFGGEHFETMIENKAQYFKSSLNFPGELVQYLADKIILGDHPFARNVNILSQNTSKITRDICLDYMKTHFCLDNLSIAIVGDIDEERLLESVNRFLAQRLSKCANEEIPAAIPHLEKKIFLIRRPTQTKCFCQFFQKSVTRYHEDRLALTILRHFLGSADLHSYLMRELREKDGLVYDISMRNADISDDLTLIVGAYDTQNNKFPETYKRLIAIWHDIKTNGPEKKQLEIAHKNYIGQITLALENEILVDVKELVQLQDLGYKIEEYRAEIRKLKEITYEDVLRVAQKYLDPEHLLFCIEGNPPPCKEIQYEEIDGQEFIEEILGKETES